MSAPTQLLGNSGGGGGGYPDGGGCECCDEVTAEAMEAFFGVALVDDDATGANTCTSSLRRRPGGGFPSPASHVR